MNSTKLLDRNRSPENDRPEQHTLGGRLFGNTEVWNRAVQTTYEAPRDVFEAIAAYWASAGAELPDRFSSVAKPLPSLALELATIRAADPSLANSLCVLASREAEVLKTGRSVTVRLVKRLNSPFALADADKLAVEDWFGPSFFSSVVEACVAERQEDKEVSGEPSTRELARYISSIQAKMKAEAFEQLDAEMLAVDVGKAPATNLVALLRTTFAMRNRLKEWSLLLAAVHREFKRRGLNADKVLRGLV